MEFIRSTDVTIDPKTRLTYDPNGGTLLCWKWCVEQFGPPGILWWFDSYYTFTFEHQEDAVLFALRWS